MGFEGVNSDSLQAAYQAKHGQGQVSGRVPL